jgi:putative pyruvate formate lyase activating enzyme
MLKLQSSGCHNVESVTPTPHIGGLAEALQLARRKGLTIPFVYNCGGYESPEIIRLLRGMVDIYLPDFKYGLSEEAAEFSDSADYSRWALESIKEMIEQVGDSLETKDDIAVRGIIIRHLVLPGKSDNSLEVLRLIKKHLSPSIPISIMSQYTPMPMLKDHPCLGKRLTKEEYDFVVEEALDMGFEEIYTQEADKRTLNPDFDREQPFQWK